MVFTIDLVFNDTMKPRIFDRGYPSIKAISNSKNRRITYIMLKRVPAVRVSPMLRITANNMITRKSFKTVTPMAVWVNGPFALISCITAIADAGDRATKIVPASRETAIFDSTFILCIKGMYSDNKNTARLPKMKVIVS
jgi:hypothetical protein